VRQIREKTGRWQVKMLDIKLMGDGEARKLIEKLKKDTSDSMAKAVGMATLYVVNTAKELAPKDTGNLAIKIGYEIVYAGMDDKGNSNIYTKVGAEENVIYAKYVEHGTGIYAVNGDGRKTPWVYYNERWGRFVYTHGNKPQPFLFPALQRNLKRISNLIVLSIREGWGKITR
jgi:HK97 gp10 family phage protein